MGIVYRGIPKNHALDLRSKFNLRFFVETGTLIGATTKWASLHFEEVSTIECNRDYFALASKNLAKFDNVNLIFGQSEGKLYDVLMTTHGLALVWLDAHWSRDLRYAKPDVVCPIMQEIDCVIADGRNHVIMVDDARLFTGKGGWPNRVSLLKKLSYNDRHTYIQDDVIVSEPCLQ